MVLIHPVLLSGGAGSRLWPLSRTQMPKQLLSLTSERTLLQETALRVAGAGRCADPVVVCGAEQRFQIAEQLHRCGITPAAVLLEPLGRNTAPAVAVAAIHLADTVGADAVLAILPTDHAVTQVDRFQVALETAAGLAAEGYLAVFGIPPDGPATGYGYIQRGAPLGQDQAFAVARFVEKPDRAGAEALLATGGCTWNSGMFLARADRLIAELDRHAPAVLDRAQAAVREAKVDLDFVRLDQAAFAAAPAVAFDVAVMERTDRAAVVEAAFGWSDVGTFAALWRLGPHDADGNAVVGDALVQDTRDSYVRSDGPLTAVIGLDDVVVVATGDAVLVTARAEAEQVKAVVATLRAAGRAEADDHRKTYRPWGSYETLHIGDRFKVKRLTVLPGQRLSLQRHYHRAEHWVVVNGTALVTRDGTELIVRENESVYVPLGTAHRLANPGKVPVELIEVQSGPYLEEDDIERLADDYRRQS